MTIGKCQEKTENFSRPLHENRYACAHYIACRSGVHVVHLLKIDACCVRKRSRVARMRKILPNRKGPKAGSSRVWLDSTIAQFSSKFAVQAILVAKELLDHIDQDYLEKSGCILPARSLRYKKARQFLRWTEKFCAPRFYTLGTLKLAVKLLVSEHGLHPPLIGSFDLNSWVTDQAKILHKLIRRAVKNSWDRRERSSRAAMIDNVETQVLEDGFVRKRDQMCAFE